MSLRSAPAVAHASLPDGGTVTVWVGVPEDSYVKQRDQTNVDLQLREGDSVLASVTTVLATGQESEAHALAQEVKAALESGEAALSASSIEPFADRMR